MQNGKNHFEAKMIYNDDTIRLMFRAEYYTYETVRRMLRLGFGAAAIAAALFLAIPTPAKVVCLMLGAWLVVAGDFPSKVAAEGVIAKRGGQESTVGCKFDDNTILVENGLRVPYKELDKLVEDGTYLYLFRDRQTAVMLPVESLRPADVDAFRELVARKSGKTWGPVHIDLLAFNLKDLLAMLERRKKAPKTPKSQIRAR